MCFGFQYTAVGYVGVGVSVSVWECLGLVLE